jgi:2-polyprenyl-3-methyl-5-hydroxy-6-metoxy-1,4-benzoquinol methylase
MKNNIQVLCPLCASDKSFDLTKLFSSKDMPVCICKKCSLVYLNPRHSNEWYESYYKNSSLRVDDNNRRKEIALYEEKQYQIKGKSVLNFISSNCNIEIDRMSVLEVGCTSGGILRYFKDSGAASVAGVDPESEYVDYGKNLSGINIYNGFLDEFYKNNKDKYNVIIMRHVVEHLFDPLTNLELVNSLLDEDGVLFVETPSLYSMGIKNTWRKNFIVEHPVIYSNKTLGLVLKRSGFKIIKQPENGNRAHLRFLAKKCKEYSEITNFENTYYSWQNVVLKNLVYNLTTPIRKFYYQYRKRILNMIEYTQKNKMKE